MASIRREIVLGAPADAVWDAIRDVGAVHTRLARGFVVDTTLEGDARLVTFADGTVVRERIVDIDDRARRLAYAVVDWVLSHHHASFQVVPDRDSGCRLVWITDLLPDSMRGMVEEFINQGCVAISHTLEGGAREP